MNIQKMCIAGIVMLASVGAVFGAGGVLPDGQGTNHVYGVINGRNQILRDITLTDVNGSGITNIPSGGIVSLDAAKLTGAIGAIDLGSGTNVPGANITGTVPAARLGANLEKLAGNDAGSLTNIVSGGIVSLDAAKLQAGTVMPAVDGSAITNLPAATSMDAANLIAGSVASAIDGGAITNLGAANLAAGGVLPALDGGALTNVTAAAPGDMLSTNATAQAKAGLLTLNGGATIAAKLTLTPSATQTLATNANVVANAAIVAVVGDGGAVTCGMGDGTAAGQMLTIRGTHADNTVTLTNAAVVPTFKLAENDVISFVWNGVSWVELVRRDN